LLDLGALDKVAKIKVKPGNVIPHVQYSYSSLVQSLVNPLSAMPNGPDFRVRTHVGGELVQPAAEEVDPATRSLLFFQVLGLVDKFSCARLEI